MSWTAYERGRHGSTGTESSRKDLDKPSPSATSNTISVPGASPPHGEARQTLHHKRSSFSTKVNSLAQVGGVNSFENFARSWQRAAGFAEFPQQRSLLAETESYDAESGRDSGTSRNVHPHRSLLREQFERHGLDSNAVLDDQSKSTDHLNVDSAPPSNPGQHLGRSTSDIFNHSPYVSSSLGSQYGGHYGSLASRIGDSPRRSLQLPAKADPDNVEDPATWEEQPILTKVVETDDGKFIEVAVGRSTMPQTVFNSVNVLIGIGVLALPLALKYSGWLVGLVFLTGAALVTKYTARLLAKCLDVDTSLITFADIAYVSFGNKARIATSLLFSLELIGTCVALVILFADSLAALIPIISVTSWKLLCGIILVPLSFLPLRLLSFTSILGIISCSGLIILVTVDGLIKSGPPGSLRSPAKQHLFPNNWSTLPLSFGLLMSPWGGHSVFPNIYRDMRHPYRYKKALDVTYSFSYLIDLGMATIGLLMFGDKIMDEITSNILVTHGYPRALSICIVIFIAIIPITKIPLNARPIFITIETLAGLTTRSHIQRSYTAHLSAFSRAFLKGIIRIALVVVFVALAVVVPSFDVIMGLLGSAMCFSICIILPLAFYLKLFGHEISKRERILDWALISICSIMALVGTVWCFLPRRMVRGDD